MRSLLLVTLIGCSGTEAAAVVELPVTTADGPIAPATTDLGYVVELTRVRIAVDTIQFTIEGEIHDAVSARAAGPRPHPGHAGGGEVTGELPGRFVLEWAGEARPALGDASLITGDYHGANFAIRAADEGDGLAAGDPLLGHAFHLTGTITKGATARPFEAVLDVEPDTAVIGAVFDARITETTIGTLAVAFLPTDPFEADTVFDGVDFDALPGAAIAIRPGDTAHNIIRRAIQTHDHYAITAR